MLLGGVVRARVPSGRIERIDTAAAEAMPGVVVATAQDLPVPRYGMVVNDQPPLAGEWIRFSGEPVVAVAAPDEETLVAAMDAIEVRIEPLPYVVDPEEAIEAGAHLVHPQLQDYTINVPTPRDGNVCGVSRVESGDVDAAFAERC